MKIYTIGFTRKTAEEFFGVLGENQIERLVDIRINNRSQLAGFSKSPDLEYFLQHLLSAEYEHNTRLAPTPNLLKRYRDGQISWEQYESKFKRLIRERKIEQDKQLRRTFRGKRVALLCSEATPERCHRRLVVEYLQRKWGRVTPVHLGVDD